MHWIGVDGYIAELFGVLDWCRVTYENNNTTYGIHILRNPVGSESFTSQMTGVLQKGTMPDTGRFFCRVSLYSYYDCVSLSLASLRMSNTDRLLFDGPSPLYILL